MSGPIRRPDWKARLSAYVDAVRREPFAYGSHDCALFAAGALEAMTGEDPARAFRGTYGTLEEGEARLRAAGFASCLDYARSLLEPVAPVHAQRGDIAVVDIGAPSFGVVLGAQIALLSEYGVALIDLMDTRVTEVLRCPR